MVLETVRNKLVGVWGYGIVGQATIAWLRRQGIAVALCEAKPLSAAQQQLLAEQQVQVFAQDEQLAAFLASCDYIIPSGGIDLRPHAAFAAKWLSELDLFQLIIDDYALHAGRRPIVIAITGTIGKTTITHTLQQLLLAAGKRCVVGGNIGVGLCDLADACATTDYVVMEVSSFQLEHCTLFKPTVAIITNIFANHLDRHDSMTVYRAAKMRIAANQGAGDILIAHWSLLTDAAAMQQGHSSERFFVTATPPTMHALARLSDTDTLVTMEQGHSIAFHPLHGMWPVVAALPAEGFVENWLLLATTLQALGLDTALIHRPVSREETLAHRLTAIATIDGITYIDDSKATIMQATIAAVAALQPRSIIVLVGGLSKGVDRLPFMQLLADMVKGIVCFGAEAEHLAGAARHHAALVAPAVDLAQALAEARRWATAGDIILLSPGGSSFDLYKHYKERGDHFIQLVQCVANK